MVNPVYSDFMPRIGFSLPCFPQRQDQFARKARQQVIQNKGDD
jgi:hypothetical protein